MSSAAFDPGIDVRFDARRFELVYGPDVVGPPTELRTLEAIRASLEDPAASGPGRLYAIAMDVHRREDADLLRSSMLLLGVVAYNAGTIGREPLRSQGHVHAVSPHSLWRPPELFEIWSGHAIVYMQERGADNPGRCFAVHARPGERVIVPPGWPHMVVNGDPGSPMVFGAICDRGYAGFEYDSVRAHRGLAHIPHIDGGVISWTPNPRYERAALQEGPPEASHPLLAALAPGQPVYRHAVRDPGSLAWIPYPAQATEFWAEFRP